MVVLISVESDSVADGTGRSAACRSVVGSVWWSWLLAFLFVGMVVAVVAGGALDASAPVVTEGDMDPVAVSLVLDVFAAVNAPGHHASTSCLPRMRSTALPARLAASKMRPLSCLRAASQWAM